MILQKLQSFIEKHQLFQPSDRLLLAISGGVDSVVLLHLLLELGYQSGLVHCNFQLRGVASDEDEAFIKSLASQYKLECYTQRFNTEEVAQQSSQSIQMVARDQRYAYFETIRNQFQYDYILTAHHVDDKIETFLLHFLRGTGLMGLQSIPAKNTFIRRPLLALSRQEIIIYQQAKNIVFREDESNTSDKYKRNFLRNHVLPKLYELEPQLSNIANDNFKHLDQMKLLYEERIEQFKKAFCTWNNERLSIDLRAVRAHPAKESLLWSCLKDYDFTAEQQRQFLEAKKGTLVQHHSFQALVEGDYLLVEPLSQAQSIRYWEEGKLIITLPSGKRLSIQLHQKPVTYKTRMAEILLDADLLEYPLMIRNWQAGDRFYPFGMKGKSQKLKDFFINNKINRLDRNKVSILVNGSGEIIWIIGHRMDERYKINATTTNIGRIAMMD